MFLRDDSAFGGFAPRDALLFVLEESNGDGTTNTFQVALRSFDLGLITNHALPSVLDPKWLTSNWTLGGNTGTPHYFDICLKDADCTGGDVLINLTAVPEPGGGALLLAGIGSAMAWRCLNQRATRLSRSRARAASRSGPAVRVTRP